MNTPSAATEPHPQPAGPLARLARLCYRRRRWVLLLWVVGTTALLYVGFGYGAPADNAFGGGQSQSALAQDLIKQHFPRQNGDTLTLAVHAERRLTNPDVMAKAQHVISMLGTAPHVVSVTSPYVVPQQVSPDGKTGFATIQLDLTSDKIPPAEAKKLIFDVRGASGGGTTFAIGGGAVSTAETPYGGPTEGIGIGAAMIVLLIAFGSLLAMGLPILTAVFGIGAGLAGIQLLGYLFPAPSFSPIVSSLLGLGVGIDYALFIVGRYREGLVSGLDPEEATVTALATAGRAVLFAGSTVVIAMLGLFVMEQRLLNATAVAASVTVLMTMITAVTLLPAMLGFTGRNIDRLKLPLLGRTSPSSPLAERWAAVIQRRPVTATVLAATALLVLAVPALSMRLSFEDATTMPHSTSSYISHKILADGFGPGYDAPLVVVAVLPPGGGNPQSVADATRVTPDIALVTPVRTSQDGQAALFIAYPKTGQLDAATSELVHTLRDRVIPRTAAPGMVVHVGGPNAGTVDFADAVSTRLPWLIAVVVGLSLVLLLVLVRSVTIALKAALMTLLSVAVSYGILTAIVQWGWLSHQLGFTEKMPITTWVPLFMFPILFGLSTDYEVFLIVRIREVYDAGAPTREAVRVGLARTARVITAAAAIMIAVFCSVLLGADAAVKQFGLGLAVAVFVDATVVRMVLVPALMEILGKANWWLPRPLARILPAAEPVSLRTPIPASTR